MTSKLLRIYDYYSDLNRVLTAVGSSTAGAGSATTGW